PRLLPACDSARIRRRAGMRRRGSPRPRPPTGSRTGFVASRFGDASPQMLPPARGIRTAAFCYRPAVARDVGIALDRFPMRRVGLVVLAIGLTGFLIASGVHTRSAEAWETARWLLLGVAVTGLVFTILPGTTGRAQ